jgi:predicted deacylase
VVAIPVTNPLAFDSRSYLVPAAYDALAPNLNRRWPGDDSGGLSDRLVAGLWERIVAAAPDVLVDLHTGTPEMLSLARTLAEAFGTGYRLAAPADPSLSGPFTGKLRVAATRAGLPAVTAELGESRTVTRVGAERGADGLERVLGALGALPGPVEPPDQTAIRADTSVRADAAGLFEPAPGVTAGAHLSAGDRLGRLYDPASYEPLATPTAEADGVVYSLARGTVIAGERLAALAVPA